MVTEMNVTLTWDGDLRFRALGQAGVEVPVDGDTRSGISPMESLLVALASCMGSDVVDILRKGRQELTGCSIRMTGTRRETHPRRFTAIRMEIDLEGRDLQRAKAERAVELSRSTYCSVWNSMASDTDFQVAIGLREAS
jgi:putative redox protein